MKTIKEENNSIRLTPLLRYTNLSSQRFNEYYPELKEKNFIKEVEDKKGRKYATLTDKGFNFLNKYNLIIDFIDDFGL